MCYFYGLYNSFPMFEKHYDFIYGKLCRLKKPFGPFLTDAEFEKIKELESRAFPKQMTGYGDMKSKKELLKDKVCSDISQLDYVVEDNFYFLAVIHYNSIFLCDFAILEKNPKKVFDFIRKKIIEYANIGKPVYAYSRSSTSYRILKYFERKGLINIVDDELTDYRGEPFHRLEMIPLKK